MKTRKALKIMDFRKYLNWSYTPRRRERHIVRGDFFTKAAARAFCCGSFPNRTRCRLSSGLISFCGRRKSSITTRTIELAASVHAVCGEFFQSPLFDESNLEP